MRPPGSDVIKEELAGESFAEQAAKNIRENDHDCVNFTAFDFCFEGLEVHRLVSLCNVNVFQFRVALQGGHAEIPSEAASFETSERRFNMNAGM